MISLKEKFETTHLSTRSMARDLFNDLLQSKNQDITLDFFGIEFASRSFMVQLYSMLAKHRSQVRFVNMNENVDQMYQLAITAYNRPAVMPSQSKNNSSPELLSL
jgi:hypothetical protein